MPEVLKCSQVTPWYRKLLSIIFDVTEADVPNSAVINGKLVTAKELVEEEIDIAVRTRRISEKQRKILEGLAGRYGSPQNLTQVATELSYKRGKKGDFSTQKTTACAKMTGSLRLIDFMNSAQQQG